MEVALEAGAEDIQAGEDGGWEVTTEREDFGAVRNALDAADITASTSELTMIPTMTVSVEEKDVPQVLKLVDLLEDHDDVQQVYANFDLPDEAFAA